MKRAMEFFFLQVKCGRVPDNARIHDPSLPSTEIWVPARAMVIEETSGRDKVVAIEFQAVRDENRKMKLRYSLPYLTLLV